MPADPNAAEVLAGVGWTEHDDWVAVVLDALAAAGWSVVPTGSVPHGEQVVATIVRDALDGGFVGSVAGTPAVSQGETVPDALRGLAEAVEAWGLAMLGQAVTQQIERQVERMREAPRGSEGSET